MSAVCPHCNRRLVVEDIHVRRYHAVREVATCGDVVVDPRASLVAAVKAGNLEVAGTVQGHIIAIGQVVLRKTASVFGDIQAPRLVVENGASLDGFLHIGDKKQAAEDDPESRASEPATQAKA